MSAWLPKDPAETFIVDFDFSDAATAIASAVVTVELESGTDPSPGDVLVGSESIVGALVQQRVGVGVPGCRYRYLCTATDTDGNVYTDYATLPVRYTAVDLGQMAVSDYTSYAEVRAALGVSDEEVGDEVLALPMYGNHLGMEFSNLTDEFSLAEDVSTTYETVSAVSLASRTTAQRRVYAAVSLFATYAVARHLGTSLGMLAPKTVSDGKALATRFSDGPYKSTLLLVEGQYEKAHAALAAALATLNSTTAVAIPLVFMGISSPSTDPVVE